MASLIVGALVITLALTFALTWRPGRLGESAGWQPSRGMLVPAASLFGGQVLLFLWARSIPEAVGLAAIVVGIVGLIRCRRA